MRGTVLVAGLVLAGLAGAWGGTGDGAWRIGVGILLALACLVGVGAVVLGVEAAAVPFLLAGLVGLAVAVGTPVFGVWVVVVFLVALAARASARAKRRADRQTAEVEAWLRKEVAAMSGLWSTGSSLAWR